MEREHITEPLVTGVRAIDGLPTFQGTIAALPEARPVPAKYE